MEGHFLNVLFFLVKDFTKSYGKKEYSGTHSDQQIEKMLKITK